MEDHEEVLRVVRQVVLLVALREVLVVDLQVAVLLQLRAPRVVLMNEIR